MLNVMCIEGCLPAVSSVCAACDTHPWQRWPWAPRRGTLQAVKSLACLFSVFESNNNIHKRAQCRLKGDSKGSGHHWTILFSPINKHGFWQWYVPLVSVGVQNNCEMVFFPESSTHFHLHDFYSTWQQPTIPSEMWKQISNLKAVMHLLEKMRDTTSKVKG